MQHYEVVVIGTGLSGVCAAIKLQEADFKNIRIFEKADDVGGTWRDNRYPGVACDVPSHLYSYSFAPNPEWSRWYAPGAEILDYVRNCAKRYGVFDQICFNTTIESATWNADRWVLKDSNSTTFSANFVISALGGLHVPKTPDLPNKERFEGQVFHTAHWPQDLDLKGKTVAVVGTGATAVQVVPQIAEEVASLIVFQRSPVWVGAKKDPEYTAQEREEFRTNPAALSKIRQELYESWEKTSVELHREGLTPNHNFACKRPTISSQYYSTFERDNVSLVSGAVDSFTQTGVMSGSKEHSVDIVIFATGFEAFNISNQINLIGIDGLRLADVWKDRVTSYNSVMVHDFPNLFLMMGPNGTGLQSALQTIEAQADYAVSSIKKMQAAGLTSLNPKQASVDAFTRDVEGHFAQTTHSKGCSSWWTDQTGFNHSIWPGSSDEYRELLAELDLADFEVETADQRSAKSP